MWWREHAHFDSYSTKYRPSPNIPLVICIALTALSTLYRISHQIWTRFCWLFIWLCLSYPLFLYSRDVFTPAQKGCFTSTKVTAILTQYVATIVTNMGKICRYHVPKTIQYKIPTLCLLYHPIQYQRVYPSVTKGVGIMYKCRLIKKSFADIRPNRLSYTITSEIIYK